MTEEESALESARSAMRTLNSALKAVQEYGWEPVINCDEITSVYDRTRKFTFTLRFKKEQS